MTIGIRLPSIGMSAAQTLYQQYEAAAIQAARANNASLWYVGNDPTGFVWQDSAGTVPATGTDPIGRLTDRAGSNAATQATAANKPTLELQANGYFGMRFDGVNDSLLPQITLPTATDNWTVIAAVRMQAISAYVHFFTGAGNSVTLAKTASVGITNTGAIESLTANTAGATTVAASGASIIVGESAVASAVKSGLTYRCAKNGVFGALVSAQTGATAYTGASIAGQISGFQFLNGALFCICYAPSAISDGDRIAIERFAALLSGANYP